MILVTYTCQRCGVQFDRRRKKKGYRYCSGTCANVRKVTAEVLRPYAEKGARAKAIAVALGVEIHAVCRGLRRYGLHREWSLRRFKKCAEAA